MDGNVFAMTARDLEVEVTLGVKEKTTQMFTLVAIEETRHLTLKGRHFGILWNF